MAKKKNEISKRGLTAKQKAFCEEYMIDLNATQSALRCGYSPKTAGSIGRENLQKPAIQSYIHELKRKRAEKMEITPETILRELRNFLLADLTQFIGLTPDEIKELPVDVKTMINGFKVTSKVLKSVKGSALVEQVIELKFVDKAKVLDMINRHIGFYEQDNKQKNINIVVIPPKRD